MARRYAGDIPRGDRQLQAAGRASSGAGRLSAVSGPGRVAVSPGRQFAVRAEGSWGLRALSNAFGVFADASRQIMDSEFKVRAKEVEREQSLLGAQYGAGVELDQLQLPAGDSIGDEAFRRSAILAAKANSDIQVYDSTEELAKKFPGRPEDFRKALRDRAQAQMKETDPYARRELLETFTRLGNRKYLELDENRRQFLRDQTRASILQATDRYGTEAARLARAGDFEAAQQEIGKLSQMTTAAGPVELGGSGAFSLVEIEERSQKANEQTRENFLLGWVERASDPIHVLAGLRSGKTGNPTLDQVIADTDQRTVSKLAHEMETDIRQQASQARQEARQAAAIARAETRARRTVADGAVDDATYVLQQGKMPPNLQQVAAVAAEFPDLAGKLNIGMRQQAAAAEFVTLPPVQRANVLADMRSDPVATKEHLQLVNALTVRDNEINADKDKYASAVEAGIIPATPLDINDPQSIAMRAEAGHEIERVWGDKVSGLGKADIAAISDALDGMTSEEQAATLGRLSSTMGDRFQYALPQIADKDPGVAMAAKVAGSRPNLAADVLQGRTLLKSGAVQKAPAADYAAAFDDKVGTALQHSPTGAAALMDAAQALYASRRFQTGKSEAPDVVASDDKADFEQAIQDLTGGIFDYNGQSVLSPEPGMDEDAFAGILGGVDDADLAVLTDDGKSVAPIMSSGAPLTAEAFKKYATLESIGDARYLVKVGNGYALDPLTHQPYVFDWQGMTAGSRRRAAEGERARREGLLPLIGGGDDALGGDAGLDRLGSISVHLRGQDVPINPSLGVLLLRMLSMAAPRQDTPTLQVPPAAPPTAKPKKP